LPGGGHVLRVRGGDQERRGRASLPGLRGPRARPRGAERLEGRAGGVRIRGPHARRHPARLGDQARGRDEEPPRQRVAEVEGRIGLVKRAVTAGFPFVVWAVLSAATPLPLAPPPPDLSALVPFVSAP